MNGEDTFSSSFVKSRPPRRHSYTATIIRRDQFRLNNGTSQGPRPYLLFVAQPGFRVGSQRCLVCHRECVGLLECTRDCLETKYVTSG
jgi:hypothetical protein